MAKAEIDKHSPDPEKRIGLTRDQYDALLVEIKDHFHEAKEKWDPIYAEGAIDMRYRAGDPWDPKEKAQRDEAMRPAVAYDELGQYLNQVLGELKANKLAVKMSPAGDGADDKTANFYENLWRSIEYESQGADVYVHAVQDALERSYGYSKIITEYQPGTFDQQLRLKQVANPDTIYPDPYAVERYGRDWEYLFEWESWRRGEFLRKFPQASVVNFDQIDGYQDWLGPDRVIMAYYWRVVKSERTLVRIEYAAQKGQQPQREDIYLDDVPKGLRDEVKGAKVGTKVAGKFKVIARREEEQRKVEKFLTNGVEVFERTAWAGKYIPYAACYGPILYMKSDTGALKIIQSMIRLARDPYMSFCFLASCELEVIGQSCKVPYGSYRNQFNADELLLVQRSMHEPVAVLTYAHRVEGMEAGAVLPPPVRYDFEAPILALSHAREEQRRSIQAAMGTSPLPTQAQKQNEKSGKALEQIEQSGQRGAFHWPDVYKGHIVFLGEQGEDLIPKIYDMPREVNVVEEDLTHKKVWINDKSRKDEEGALPSIKGTHAVTVAAGPDFPTEREESRTFAESVMNSEIVAQVAGPEKMAKIVAKAMRLSNAGPIANQMAEILDPQQDKGGPPNPEHLQELLGQAKKFGEMAQQQIQQLTQALQQEQVKQDAEYKRAELDSNTRIQVAKIQSGTQTQKAGLDSSTDLTIQEMKGEIERAKLELKKIEMVISTTQGMIDRQQSGEEAEAGRAHDRGMKGLDHASTVDTGKRTAAHDVEMSTRSHSQALEAGREGHQQKLEQVKAAPKPAAKKPAKK